MQFKDSIGYLLHQLAHLIDAESDQVLSERLGIGFAQFKVLMILEEHDSVSQKYLADQLRQTQASISRQTKILQDKKLVVINANTNNRREKLVSLTPRGEQMVEKSINALNAYHSPMFASLSDKEQLKIVESLQLIRQSIDR